MKPQNLILGFIMGALTGAALGILLAPEEGKRTRRKVIVLTKKNNRLVAHKLSDCKDKIEQQIHNLVDKDSKNLDNLINEAYIEAVENNDEDK